MSLEVTVKFNLRNGFNPELLRQALDAAAAVEASNPDTIWALGKTELHEREAPASTAEPMVYTENNVVQPPIYDVAGIVAPLPPTPQQSVANEAAEVEAAISEEPKRRARRTKAQIEADTLAAALHTQNLAVVSGLIPPTQVAPRPQTVPPVQQSNVVPPGAAIQNVVQPQAQVAIPPFARPQTPSMPATPAGAAPAVGMAIGDLREAIRQINATHKGIAYKVMKDRGWFTPEAVPPDQHEWLMNAFMEAMAAAPPVAA